MEPIPVMSLEYDRPGTYPWRSVTRLMAAAVVAQGVALVGPNAWSAGLTLATRPWSLTPDDLPRTWIELCMAAAGVGLVFAGVLARRGRAIGRTLAILLQVVVAGLAVAGAAVPFWQLTRRIGPGNVDLLRWGVGLVLYLPGSLLLPAVIWAFFRRPEVRAAFNEA